MTDRINHRAEAERLLNDADDWGQQADEPTPEVGELICLAYSAAHALLAIHDTLTAADPAPTNPLTVTHPWPMAGLTHTHGTLWGTGDRYALNEARQREEAEFDTPSGRAFTAQDKEAMDAVQARINSLGGWLPAMEKALAPEPDPLDEDNHQDRLDRDGMRLNRVSPHHWHPASSGKLCGLGCKGLTLLNWDSSYGPLTFAPKTEADLLGPSIAECSRCGGLYEGTAEATMEHHRACTGETPENPMGDPLDEGDHRERLDSEGDPWGRNPGGCWHITRRGCPGCERTLAYVDEHYGPLTFAPEAPQDATRDDLSASGDEGGSVEGPDADIAHKAAMEAAFRKMLAIVEGWEESK